MEKKNKWAIYAYTKGRLLTKVVRGIQSEKAWVLQKILWLLYRSGFHFGIGRRQRTDESFAGR